LDRPGTNPKSNRKRQFDTVSIKPDKRPDASPVKFNSIFTLKQDFATLGSFDRDRPVVSRNSTSQSRRA